MEREDDDEMSLRLGDSITRGLLPVFTISIHSAALFKLTTQLPEIKVGIVLLAQREQPDKIMSSPTFYILTEIILSEEPGKESERRARSEKVILYTPDS